MSKKVTLPSGMTFAENVGRLDDSIALFRNRSGENRMVAYAVVEVNDGLTVVEVMPDQSPEDAAISAGGVLIDPGPYSTMDDANSAIDLLDVDTHEDL